MSGTFFVFSLWFFLVQALGLPLYTTPPPLYILGWPFLVPFLNEKFYTFTYPKKKLTLYIPINSLHLHVIIIQNSLFEIKDIS